VSMRVSGSKVLAFKITAPRYTRTGKYGLFGTMPSARKRRASGLRERTSVRSEEGSGRFLDQLLNVILDLVSQGHRIRPLTN
jgi:hypothetical protein